jgi:hypothetical protein
MYRASGFLIPEMFRRQAVGAERDGVITPPLTFGKTGVVAGNNEANRVCVMFDFK